MKALRWFLLAAVAACVSATAAPDFAVKSAAPTTVTVTPDTVALQPGEVGRLTCTPTNKFGTILTSSCAWKSGDTSVVRVTATSTQTMSVTARKPGRVWVSATVNKKVDTAWVTVVDTTPAPPPPPPVPTLARVSVAPDSVSLLAGASQVFTATDSLSDGTAKAFAGACSATGGSVVGCTYTAGPTAGSYRLIAAESTLADTALVLVTAPPLPPPPPPPGCDSAKTALTFLAQFEGPKPFQGISVNEADVTPASHTATTAMHHECNGSARMALNKSDPREGTSWRTELKLLPDSGNGGVPLNGVSIAGKLGGEVWVGWSVYIPADFVFETASGVQETIAQAWGNCGRSPPWEIQIDKGAFEVFSRYGTSGALVQNMVGTVPILRGTWHHFVWHEVWSNTGTGVLEVWLNGTKFVDRHNVDTIWKDCTDVARFKLGIYKWSWKTTGDASIVSSRVLYLDNLRATDGAHGSYTLVGPR